MKRIFCVLIILVLIMLVNIPYNNSRLVDIVASSFDNYSCSDYGESVVININDCERVSRALDIPLDENDVTDGKSYSFNVSSYGLDRSFKTDYDFNKHIGQDVEIKFYAPFNNKKMIIAKLVSFNNQSITIEENNTTFEIDRKLIANICAHIVF